MTTPDLSIQPPQSRNGNRVKVLALVAMCSMYFLSYFHRAAVPGPLFDRIQSELETSASAVTALGAIFLYIYAGAQLFAGMAADRFGGRRTLLAGGLVMCIGGLAFPFAPSLPTLLAARALTGLGASFMYLSIVKEIDTLWGPKHFAAILGAALFAGYSGGLAATVPLGLLTKAADSWRTPLVWAGLLSAVSLIATWLLLRRLARPTHTGNRFPLRALLDIVRNRRSRPLLLVSLINFPVYFLFPTAMGTKFLKDFLHYDSTTASSFVLVMMATSASCVFFAGPLLHLTAHRRRPHMIAASALVMLSPLVMLWGVVNDAPPWLFLVCFVLLAVSTGSGPAYASTMKELNQSGTVSLSIAVSNCAAYVGLAVLANVAGVILDAFRGHALVTAAGTVYPKEAYAVLFAILAALGLVSLTLAAFIPETRGDAQCPGPSQDLKDEFLQAKE
ncbi:MAG: MFS transporter [Phycisphaerae bacterium]